MKTILYLAFVVLSYLLSFPVTIIYIAITIAKDREDAMYKHFDKTK